MKSLKELEADKTAIEMKMARLKKRRAKDLARVKSLCKKNGFTATDLKGALADGRSAKKKTLKKRAKSKSKGRGRPKGSRNMTKKKTKARTKPSTG